ncbi:hypothetical protein ACK4CS_19030, partial [Enterococcus gallinarum]
EGALFGCLPLVVFVALKAPTKKALFPGRECSVSRLIPCLILLGKRTRYSLAFSPNKITKNAPIRRLLLWI